MKTPIEIHNKIVSFTNNVAMVDNVLYVKAKFLIEAMEAYHSQFAQPSDVSDSFIVDFAANYCKTSKGSLSPLFESGIIVGIKLMQSGQIKSSPIEGEKLTKEEAMKVYSDLCFCGQSTYTKGVCDKCGKQCD